MKRFAWVVLGVSLFTSTLFSQPLRHEVIPHEWILAVKQPFLKGGKLLLRHYSERARAQLYLYHVKLAASEEKAVLADKRVLWSSPNYRYLGERREWHPNDPGLALQPFHQIEESIEAWDIQVGKTAMVVAVTDDGIETTHEDLKNQLWHNENEIAGNGIDDDGNGYIDDTEGWNFVEKNNDVNPDKTFTHGTHVSGIIAAEQNNGKGGSGIAPGVRLMPLKFYGANVDFTSALIAETYAYAVDNGAKILTTSYTIDDFVGDKTYLETLDYAYGKGLLLFNSAGNSAELNPGRQAFESLLLVCSTNTEEDKVDKLSDFSNYGVGVDVCAPGEGIYSTVVGNKYEVESGTSMASPNAAAVAALIWSAHPEWTRDQVAAQLLATCNNIDKGNETYLGWMGSGRVNARAAMTVTGRAPYFDSVAKSRRPKSSCDCTGCFRGRPFSIKEIGTLRNAVVTPNGTRPMTSRSLSNCRRITALARMISF